MEDSGQVLDLVAVCAMDGDADHDSAIYDVPRIDQDANDGIIHGSTLRSL